MKRTRLPCRKPLKARDGFRAPRTPMKRSKKRRRPPRTSVAKREARWSEQFRSEDFVRFVKGLRCAMCGTRADIEVHHDPPRSRGGTWKDTSPLCKWVCHPYRHSKGVVTFWREVGTTYQAANEATQAKWLGVADLSDMP